MVYDRATHRFYRYSFNGSRSQAICTLEKKLSKIRFDLVLTSPLKRSLETCAIAGFSKVAVADSNLIEWNYGIYEGWTRKHILVDAPTWDIFVDGAPEGESVEDVKNRTHCILQKIALAQENVLLFSHGHFLRLFLTQWLQVPCKQANSFLLATASISILGFNDKEQVVNTWNDVCHLPF